MYADKKTKGLKDKCKGKPPRQAHRGGMEGQLRKLRNNIHPKTGARLPDPVEVDVDTMPDKPFVECPTHSPPEGFYEYVPQVFPAAQASDSQLAAERRKQFLERTRAKDQRNAINLATLAEVGPTDPMDSLPLIALTGIQPGQDIGGGVWDYPFPDEQQHGVTCPPADVPDREIRCIWGHYRIKAKGPACRGNGCC